MLIQTSNSERWYVAYTQPNREDLAVDHLLRQGFAAFVPHHRVTERRRGKFATRLAPLFPRYVFVAFDVERHRWRSINGTRGIVRLICASEVPRPLQRGVAEALIANDQSGVSAAACNLQVGEKVRIIVGPMAGMIGVFERLDDSGRINLLLACLGAPLRATVPRNNVIPAGTETESNSRGHL
jgi:transcriptional antiterminator RfaH